MPVDGEPVHLHDGNLVPIGPPGVGARDFQRCIPLDENGKSIDRLFEALQSAQLRRPKGDGVSLTPHHGDDLLRPVAPIAGARSGDALGRRGLVKAHGERDYG